METPISPLWPSWRLVYTICAFFIMVAQQCMNNAPNFAILCMIKPSENRTSVINIIRLHDNCSYALNNAEDMVQDDIPHGELEWTKHWEWLFLSSYFYGYMVVQPVAGRLADKFGGKLFLLTGLIGQAVMFMLIPVMARTFYWLAVATRTLQGFLAGFAVPSIYQLYTVWAHPTERAALMSFAYGGYAAGSLLVFPITSLLCQTGWTMVFYVIGGLALVLGITCNILIHSSLDEHPWISTREIDYLRGGSDNNKMVPTIPWRQMITSCPILTFIITHICHSYGLIVLNLCLPRYLRDTMHFSLKENGYYSSVLYIGSITSRVIVMLLFSKLYRKSRLSLTVFRRIVYCGGNLVTALVILLITFLTCEQRMLIVLLIFVAGASIDVSFTGAYWISCIDMAPAFAGLLTGISNSAATLSGIIAPLAISSVVTEGSKAEWNYLYYSMAVSYVFSMLVYGNFGSSEKQKWGDFICKTSKPDGEAPAVKKY
ncbi:putative inorganic phosphate cotransporter [Eupeodes corollae]|uniref:putative inorganic phosphate cotransporter n=1 Tax=Eupeodes corollae TaxID=290404 RepID=UPI002493CBCB|nr:putative inorganic phosphate cotransporter [Eupeodes corollae]